jgi:hypothetical protein
MKLQIETFSNLKGGSTFFKAIGHPLAAIKARALFAELTAAGPLGLYDPLGLAPELLSLYDLSKADLRSTFVQKTEALGGDILGVPVQPITFLPEAQITTLLVIAFDAGRLIEAIRALVPAGCRIISLDDIRLPDAMLTNTRRYLDPLNFATNFAFMRDANGLHTRLVTSDCWSGWGAPKPPSVWFMLFDAQGTELAQWQTTIPARGASLVVDSHEVRTRFGLGEFTGTLFVHVLGAAGHEIVKYALDTYGDDESVLSCTHDANAWPSELYAGLPAPADGERVVLWIQNSHPIAIPAQGVGLNLMGHDEIRWLDHAIAPFGTYALNVASIFPGAHWPQQLEIQAGKYFVRPRYEISQRDGRSRIAHANVERNDLQPDPAIPSLTKLMGKGFILPAPIFPTRRWRNLVLPTPMATTQQSLPLAARIYDAQGTLVAEQFLGNMPRAHCALLDVNELLSRNGIELEYGHIELTYDFRDGGQGDGWLHALFRYIDGDCGHIAETSFGAHIYNTPLTYKNEPQSYAGAPPGLSTRLFLRLGNGTLDSFCHLIYPASTPWHPLSTTRLELYDGMGLAIADHTVHIPCSGSLHWRYSEAFDAKDRQVAGENAYVLIRDTTCRLFGFHGLIRDGVSVAMDHMFGF